MLFSNKLYLCLGLAATVIASPVAEPELKLELETRQTASGCNYLYGPPVHMISFPIPY
jgi:hypothetical protein